MATFVLFHGAGSDSWYWHRLIPMLRSRGHDVRAPDLPVDDHSAGLRAYGDVVVEAVGDRHGLVFVAQSFSGFIAPLVCDRVPTRLLVTLNAMIPIPGESLAQWGQHTGWTGPAMETADDFMEYFFHDLPPELAKEALKHGKEQSGTPFEQPWPLSVWPDVPTKVLIGREDRFFPADFQRGVAQERLGVVPDEIDGGHLLALSRPDRLADRLETYLQGGL